MVFPSRSGSLEDKIAQLEAELATERQRADVAEEQLARLHESVQLFKEKQEKIARARDARQAHQTSSADVQVVYESESVPQSVTSSSGVSEVWDDPDPSLDDRLTRYLESEFEPDSSRDWMLKG